MAKSKEELNKTKEEVEAVNGKLAELTPEEIAQVNGGGTGPLYVVDGVPTTRGHQTLDSGDFESMQVLKDVSAGAHYGARAAN